MQEQVQAIKEALDGDNKAQARELLKPLLQMNPDADIWVLAAKSVESDEHAILCLKNALQQDPNHAEATHMLQQLERETASGAEATAEEATEVQTDVYEMLWDCKYCGATKLLGKTHRFCPSCGSAQDPEWRYFPSDEEKVAVHDHVYVGVDQTCPACGTASAGNAEHCGRCGSPLSEAAKVKVQSVREKAEGQQFETEDFVARLDAERDAAVGRVQPQAVTETESKTNWWKIAVPAVLIGIVGLIFIFIFWTQETTVYVSDHRWERTIQIEELRAEDEKRECSSMPAGAYNVDRRREQVDTRRVPDGETCTNRQVDQGDGTFRQERVCETKYREEPVMGDVCYYTIDRWRSSRSVDAQGNLGAALYWPETNITRTGSCVGCERESGRDEKFLLILTGEENKTYECPVENEEEWRNITLETNFTLEIAAIGGGARCNTLERVQ